MIRILTDLDLDPLACQKIARVMEQYNLIDTNPEGFKESFLLTLELSFPYDGILEPADRKAFIDSHLVCLSFLQLSTEKGDEAIKKNLDERSYAPLTDLLQADV